MAWKLRHLAAAPAGEAEGLDLLPDVRAQRLVGELLDMVAGVRAAAIELERELLADLDSDVRSNAPSALAGRAAEQRAQSASASVNCE